MASQLGLGEVSVFWDPGTGKVQAMFLDFDRLPPPFDVRGLFSEMGHPQTALLALEGITYRVVFAFPEKGALVMMDAVPQEWPYLCLGYEDLSNEVLMSPVIVLAEEATDPLLFIEWVANPEDLREPQAYTGLSQEGFLEALSTEDGCVVLQ